MSSKAETFILLCSGQSKKMSSYGSRSLLRIGPDYLISKQINAIREVYPRAEIICVLGYESERVYKLIKDYKVTTVFNDNYRDTYSLKSLIYGIRQSSTNRTFIVHGDLCFLPEHIDFDLTSSTALVDYATSKEITVNIQAGQVLQFGYGFSSCWQKIIYFNKKGTDILKNFSLSDTDLKRIDFEIFNYLIDKGIHIQPFQGKTQEINSHREYKCVR